MIPVLAVGLGWAIGLPALPLRARPRLGHAHVVNAFILAQEYEADVETVAGAVSLSTFVSFGTVAIVTALLLAVGTLAR